MARNTVQFQKGLSEPEFERQYGTEAACRNAGQPLALRRHEGYDHGYYFISTFVEDHLRFHARNLGGKT